MQKPHLAAAYKLLQRAAAYLNTNKAFYQTLIVDNIRQYEVLTLQPGTFGQFLFGIIKCTDYGETTAECSPVGIGSLPNEKLSLCSKQVWYYQDGRYVALTDPIKQRSEEADLYVPLKFEGLKPEDIQYLSAGGIKRVTLYSILNGSPTQQSLSIKRSYLIPLEESAEDKYDTYMLPIEKGFKAQTMTEFGKQKDYKEDHNISEVHKNYNFSGSGLIAFIFIIIIIIIILWAYQAQGKNTK